MSHARLQRNNDLASALVDDELVLMSTASGKYYSMAGSARQIWELLEHPQSLDQLLATLSQRYQVEESVCRADVEPFIAAMCERGLLLVRD